ncbi:hypothetical protein EVAR_30569_1 [Eumeta japonica]|uniref:Uncharacterized protein n=1 Tax=Eumeta variegata TaxID=151549 RepID=A0A4C1VPP4_EUMVA|nr:hypothetical protein EVAR_30569_1 [Eumeta japonica]
MTNRDSARRARYIISGFVTLWRFVVNMAVIKLLVSVMGLCFVGVIECGGDAHSDLFCIDPDTGDSHPVNATWQSNTFCGSYTCKLRKTKAVETYTFPPTLTDRDDIEPAVTAIKRHVDGQNSDAKLKSDVEMENKVNETENISTEEKDRYLTDSEIKAITKFLNTVKRSDLDALLDLYNTAEDVYKEMETSASENIDITGRRMHTDENARVLQEQKSLPQMSYIYDPKFYYNSIQTKTPNYSPVSAQATNNQISQPITVMPKHVTNGYSFAYPILSYPTLVQNPFTPKVATALQTKIDKNDNNKPECLNGILNQNSMALYSPFVNKLINPVNYMQSNYKNYQNLQLIPYPVSYQYDISYPYLNTPRINNQQVITSGVRPHIGTAIVTHVPNNQLYNPQTQLINQRTTNDEKKNEMPASQTKPFSANILDDIRAKLMEKSKKLLYLSPKKVKLEKIGKVLRLDQLKRNQRNTESPCDTIYMYETVIEKTECPQDERPGYFRMGDLAQPYPACCPRRIDD